ncbi:hypothetical protein [Alkalilimnicola sp. S0819]|uniref:hypothetical protein n=1 Tax=Alkalilimnicola sp. S0819 TaxID=2613922 RepID=UPI0012625E63|nr:hypothetical protein [Alkalilimnicola sp. S0819]KAB7623408.1 hypothetical protein F3N43_09935 [Alkalilimnicola sp. S0819]MPQ16954.1 hypothetical protein [Alkalilimnicola sp. S0819]
MILNLTENPSLDDVREFIRSGDDTTDTQVRVTRAGKAELVDATGAPESHGDILFRFHTWDAGNGYVGEAAARDDVWVQKVQRALTENWPNPKQSSLEV